MADKMKNIGKSLKTNSSFNGEKEAPLALPNGLAEQEDQPDNAAPFLRQVGRKIAEFRGLQCGTQAQFAKQVGVCTQMVQYWESGRNITLKTLYRLSQHLAIPIEKFLPDSSGVDREYKSAVQANSHFSFEPKLGSLSETTDSSQTSLPMAKILLRMNLASLFSSKGEKNGFGKLKILIVEDNPLDVRLLKEAFSQWAAGDFELLHETSLRGALQMLSTEKVDLILLDLFLPGTAGLETIAEIQKANSKTPLIILTGLYDDLMASNALQMGADMFLPKGLEEITALVKALRNYAEFHI